MIIKLGSKVILSHDGRRFLCKHNFRSDLDLAKESKNGGTVVGEDDYHFWVQWSSWTSSKVYKPEWLKEIA